MSKHTLDEKSWQKCISNMPIYGIDIVIYNTRLGVLMGKRKNNPAKDKYFVPGGRVYKNETRSSAFNRILSIETGLSMSIEHSQFLGIYEHFYNESYWTAEESTHYIIEARLIEIKNFSNHFHISLEEQHLDFKWFNNEEVNDSDIHNYSKDYLKSIEKYSN